MTIDDELSTLGLDSSLEAAMDGVKFKHVDLITRDRHRYSLNTNTEQRTIYSRSIKGLGGCIHQIPEVDITHNVCSLIDSHNLDTFVKECVPQNNTADTT